MSDVIYKQLERDMIDTSVSVEKPIVVFIGGQPGSNKKRVTEKMVQFFGLENYVRININSFRDKHPEFSALSTHFDRQKAEKIDKTCFKWSEQLLEKAALRQRNIFFETSMQDKEWLIDKIKKMSMDYGYQIYASVIAMPAKMSRFEILRRCTYEGDSAKWVSLDIHDKAYNALPDTIQQIERSGFVKDIFICDKKCEITWRNSENMKLFSPCDNRRGIKNFKFEIVGRTKLQLVKERAAQITEVEKGELISDIETLLYYMKTHDAPSGDIAEAEHLLESLTEKKGKKLGFLNIHF